jgi:uncharacterized protein
MSRNHLAGETSPYLLQHKDNPVNWHAWGEPAFEEARRLNRPVLLSVGYAACHWCHVMAHESFEDPRTAELMNSLFINIKVDREERPDIDRIYMSALHSLGEQGGWPLTMFLTPDALPFWGGTYFPPEAKFGRPSFRNVLSEISRIWIEEPQKIHQNADAIATALRQSKSPATTQEITSAEIYGHAEILVKAVDPQYGGLKGAPKFPQAPIFAYLWEVYLRNNDQHARDAVLLTLTNISNGGIYDHLAGGIARYSTDHKWLAPHFEKMLYDNAQFVSLLARAWLATEDPLYLERLHETVNFVLTDMTTAKGCFTSSYDADSEGEEGKYYVWERGELERCLDGDELQIFCEKYDVSEDGNWEGRNILNRTANPPPDDAATAALLKSARAKLLKVRKSRPPPQHDDKVLADWNGLFITALAEAALVFGNRDWRDAAVRAFDANMNIFWQDGRLLHSHRLGSTRHEAVADDYANLIEAALGLHALTAEPRYIATARELAAALERNHWDEGDGGFFHASLTRAQLPIASRTIDDDVTPSANALMIKNYGTLYHLTGDTIYQAKADQIIAAFLGRAMDNPFSAPSLLKNILLRQDAIQIVQVSGRRHAGTPLLALALKRTGLNAVVSYLDSTARLPASHPAFGKSTLDGKTTLYVCRGMTCASPATDPQELASALELLGVH